MLILRIRPFKCSKCGYISKITGEANNASVNIKNSLGHTDYACGESA
jgi:hypothetical protein